MFGSRGSVGRSHRERVEAATEYQSSRQRRRISLELNDLERSGGMAPLEPESPAVEHLMSALQVTSARRRASIDCPRNLGSAEETTSPSDRPANPFVAREQGREAEGASAMAGPAPAAWPAPSQPVSRGMGSVLGASVAGAAVPVAQRSTTGNARKYSSLEQDSQVGAMCTAGVPLLYRPQASEFSMGKARGPAIIFQAQRPLQDMDASLPRSGRERAGTAGSKAGTKLIPESWAGESKLQEWVDWSQVNDALRPPELLQAQAALIAGSQRAPACAVTVASAKAE